jgi:hypothetical protein
MRTAATGALVIGLLAATLVLWWLVRPSEPGADRPGAADLSPAPVTSAPEETAVLEQVEHRAEREPVPTDPAAASIAVGSRLARLGVADVERETDEMMRTIRLLSGSGRVVATFSTPVERDPSVRIVELTLGDRRLEIEVDQSPTHHVKLTLADGRVVELRGPDRSPREFPSEYAAHIEMLDAIQRELNAPMVGDEPIVPVEAECSSTPIVARGECFGDCEDLACARANANLNRECSRLGGCCRVDRCVSFCERVPTAGKEIAVMCFASKAGNPLAGASIE